MHNPMPYGPRIVLTIFVMEDEDLFEATVLTEERLRKQGYEEGYQHGLKEGVMEEYIAGQTNGWEVAAEIGYYLGFTEMWLKLLEGKPGEEKHLRALATLSKKISEFQILNTKSKEYSTQFTQIQAKFKQVLSLLKVPVEYKETQLSF